MAGLAAAAVGAAASLWLGWHEIAAMAAGARAGPDLALLAVALLAPLACVVMVQGLGRLQREGAAHAEALRAQSRHATLDLLDALPVAVALCDVHHGTARINHAMAQLLNIDRGDRVEVPLDWRPRVTTEDPPDWPTAWAAALQTGLPQWLPCTLQVDDLRLPMLAQLARVSQGSEREVAVSLTPRDGEAGVAQQVVLHLRDLLGLAEAEKWQFGQEVHDELGQRLSGMAFFAKALQRKLQAAGREEAHDATWLASLANESMSVARGLARGLVPVGAEDSAALALALADLCDKVGTAFNKRCTAQVEPDFHTGGSAQANHLYHAVQELVTNACKHGDARQVEVRLEVLDSCQRVTVRDDGSGLHAAGARLGMGLKGVRSRAAYLGGSFTLEDADRGGVLATLVLPLPAAAAPAAGAGAEGLSSP